MLTNRTLLRASLLLTTLSLGGCALGVTELLIILAIVVVMFGASRLPQLGKALGETVKGFKESSGQDQLEGDKAKKLEAKEVEKIEEAKVERVDKVEK